MDYFNIQLLTIVLLNMTRYPPEDTNIDRGDSRGQFWYSFVNIINVYTCIMKMDMSDPHMTLYPKIKWTIS